MKDLYHAKRQAFLRSRTVNGHRVTVDLPPFLCNLPNGSPLTIQSPKMMPWRWSTPKLSMNYPGLVHLCLPPIFEPLPFQNLPNISLEVFLSLIEVPFSLQAVENLVLSIQRPKANVSLFNAPNVSLQEKWRHRISYCKKKCKYEKCELLQPSALLFNVKFRRHSSTILTMIDLFATLAGINSIALHLFDTGALY